MSRPLLACQGLTLLLHDSLGRFWVISGNTADCPVFPIPWDLIVVVFGVLFIDKAMIQSFVIVSIIVALVFAGLIH